MSDIADRIDLHLKLGRDASPGFSLTDDDLASIVQALRDVERYEKTLQIIAGLTDLLIATQAAGALTNIGAKVK